MKSVHALPPDGLDTPLDAPLTRRTEPSDPFAGWERVGDGPPRDPVAGLVKTLLCDHVGPAVIVRALDGAGFLDEWRVDPVCLGCGLRGGFASPPRDELDGLCAVCRDRRERNAHAFAHAFRAALDQRLTWLKRPSGWTWAKARGIPHTAIDGLERARPGRPRDDSDIEAAIKAIAGTEAEPTSRRVAESLYPYADEPYDSLYKRLHGRDGYAFSEVFEAIRRRALG